MVRRQVLKAMLALTLSLGCSSFAWAEQSKKEEVDSATLNSLLTESLQDLQKQSYILKEMSDGQPMVLNFWATWCPPCVKEMPDLDELAKEFKEVQFVGLAIDSAKNMKAFEKKVQVDYPLLVGGPSYISSIRKLGNPGGGLPFTLIFDKQGTLKHKILGQIKVEEIREILENIIKS